MCESIASVPRQIGVDSGYGDEDLEADGKDPCGKYPTKRRYNQLEGADDWYM